MARFPSEIDVCIDRVVQRAIGRYDERVRDRGRISPVMRVRLWLAVRLIRAAQWVVGVQRKAEPEEAHAREREERTFGMTRNLLVQFPCQSCGGMVSWEGLVFGRLISVGAWCECGATYSVKVEEDG